jgi:hypothetical protein
MIDEISLKVIKAHIVKVFWIKALFLEMIFHQVDRPKVMFTNGDLPLGAS